MMMVLNCRRIVSTFICLVHSLQFLMGQVDTSFLRDFLLGDRLNATNIIASRKTLDFSTLWTQTPNSNVFGVIGTEHQRLRIKLLSVEKSIIEPAVYNVKGKSYANGHICSFQGRIIIKEIRSVQNFHYGVDEVYMDSALHDQGVIIAEYKFVEDADQAHSGTFTGILYTKWYLDRTGQVRYDDIEMMSDGYMNNAYIGTWTSHRTRASKLSPWGDHRVPLSVRGFDIGAGEFSPSDEYLDKGWQSYRDAWLHEKEDARKIELSEWWE
jgi:hypothetical protein